MLGPSLAQPPGHTCPRPLPLPVQGPGPKQPPPLATTLRDSKKDAVPRSSGAVWNGDRNTSGTGLNRMS